ncbi:MAG: tetratricopeptide repeat protein [Burkholderiales bacterium]|nr:tetratricopeptide repeat protein [Burkholderiales bacterium]
MPVIQSAVVFLLFAITHSAFASNESTFHRLYEAGLRADSAKEFREAKDFYENALNTAKINKLPEEFISNSMLNLGRMQGYLCDYPAAEKTLKEALSLEESRPNSGRASDSAARRKSTVLKISSALAVLTYDQENYPASVSYFEKAIPLAEELGILNADPLQLSDVLDDFALALEKAGHIDKAASTRTRAASIREPFSNKKPRFRMVRFREVCQSNR